MKSTKKTNAARILDGLGIAYELKEYPVDLNDLSAVHVAASVGMPVEMVTRKIRDDGDERGMIVYGYKFRPVGLGPH